MTPPQIAVVVEELRATSIGARVGEVAATETECLVLGLRAEPAARRLLLSCNVSLSRVHFVTKAPLGERETPFGQLVSSRLKGRRLAAAEQPEGERIVRLWFGGDGGEGLCLVAEMFGRRPNLVLLDASGTIQGAWRTFPGGARPIAPGVRYQPLPPPAAPRAGTSEEGPPWTSAEWEAAMEPKERELLLSTVRGRLEALLGKEVFRIDGVLKGLERGLAAGQRCEEVRKEGEVLKASLHKVQRGAESVELQDFFDPAGATVRISLDPRMGPTENLERIFRRYRRLRDSVEGIEARIDSFRKRHSLVVTALDRVRACDDPDDLAAIESEWRTPERKQAPRKSRKGAPAGIRRYVSAEGIEIWVGRGDEENDHLTFRLARGNDHWLHVRDFAGSHVVVRTGKRDLTQETLLDAAHLAVFHSKARGQAAVEVVHTQAKFVRKPRGARPGQVSLGDSRSLTVRWEESRMARLAARITESGGSDEAERS